MTVADVSSTSDIESLESLTTTPDTHKLICNWKTHRDTNKIVIFAVSKDGCLKRAEIVKIGGVNLVKINFVDLKRNLLTIKNML